MISAIIVVLLGIPLIASIVHHKRLRARNEQFLLERSLPEVNAADDGDDTDLSDEDFALSWYRAGVDKGWDMKTKDTLVTDLTVEQAFTEEWNELDDEEAEN